MTSRNNRNTSNNNQNQNILFGVLAGTLIGAVTAVMMSSKGKVIRDGLHDAYDYASEKYEDAADSINESAHDISDRFLHRKQPSDNTNLAIGAVAGGILGISAIIFLTSNSGKGLREKMVHSFENITDKAHSYQDMAHSAVDSMEENISPWLNTIEKLVCAFTDKKMKQTKKSLSSNNTLDNILDWAVVAAQVFQSLKK
ncbi:MAG TPA: YtxH domain-containing protein [Parachlamydiaceae bacterium]|nr:YtxH domain-containing protein [Parachlamydiaceae bacterium]